MPRPPWASDEQSLFLTERRKAFADSQVSGTSRAWLTATAVAFVDKWPLPDPTPEEITAADSDLQAAKNVLFEKQRLVSMRALRAMR